MEKLLVHRFPITKEELAKHDFDENAANLTPVQKKGLRSAGIGFLVFLAVILVLCFTGVLADETGSLTNSAAPFTKGIVWTVTLALFVPGVCYGVAIGK